MKNFLTMSERFAQMGASVEKVRNLDGIMSQSAALKGLLKKQRGYVWRSTMGLETIRGSRQLSLNYEVARVKQKKHSRR